MKKVFLDNLPRRGKLIDWKNSVGYKVNFIYDNIEGEVEILDYNKRNLDVKYNNIVTTIYTGSLSECQLGDLLGTKTKRYYYNIGDIVTTNSGKIEILEQIRILNKIGTQKGYKYKCLIDGNIDQIHEVHLKNGVGCNICSIYGYKVLKGHNDLWTTYPKIAKLLKYPEQGYEVSHGSHQSAIFICPNCGHENNTIIKSVVNQGFSCPMCSDGISYPNKFIRSFLDQLNEEYISEYCPDWSYIKHNNPKLTGKKKYDNLLINKNEIWEVHGLQHYEESFSNMNKYCNYNKNLKLLEEEQENDKIKKELAETNGYKYIVIDARYSDSEYIKNNLLNLLELKRYDLSKIDWLKCHEYACSSLVKVVCDYWNNGIRNTTKIGYIMNISRSCVRGYLKQGVKLGWCDYDAKKASSENRKINGSKGKTVIQLSLKEEYITEFKSISETERQLNIKHISCCCRKNRKTAGGFKWMYKEDYDKYIENNKIV